MALRTLPARIPLANQAAAPLMPKKADPHYLTEEHRAWSREVIRRANFRCEDCGAGGRLYADHVAEIRDGGARLDPANGRARCASCHGKKTAKARALRLSTPTRSA